MRILLILSAFVCLGCATTASSTATGEQKAAVSEPMASLCGGNDGCAADHFCVKLPGSTEGVCSSMPSGVECQRTSDCMAGASCHRFVGQGGICFRP